MGLIRFYLAVCVVFAHVSHGIPFISIGGLLAVESFFIISGFYMAMILNEKYVGEGFYVRFISNRFLKIYPVYFACVFISIILYFMLNDFGGSFLSFFQGDGADLQARLYLALTNVIIFGQDIVMFLGLENGGLSFVSDFRSSSLMTYKFLSLPPAWSLSLELTFYLLAPIFIRRSNKCILFLIVSILILKTVFLTFVYDNDPWTYRFFIFELPYFLLGVFAYNCRNNLKQFSGFLLVKVIIFFLICFLVFDFKVNGKTFNFDYRYWAGNLFLISFSLFIPFVFRISKMNKFDRSIGEYSYPIYLIHWPLMIYIAPLLDTKFKAEIILLLSLLISFVMLKLIMSPIESFRQSRVTGSIKSELITC